MCSGPDVTQLVPVAEAGATLQFGKPAIPVSIKDAAGGDTRDGKRFVIALHEQTREEQGIGIIRP